jgi:hypothetical protein
MSCKKCLIDPNFHSFVNFGTIGTTRLFYTAPARSLDYNKDGTKLENFKRHLLDTKGEPWIWVMDCNGMTVKDYTDINFTMEFLKTLSANYANTLKSVLIIKPNVWIKTSINTCKNMFKTSIFDKIQYCEGSPIELFLFYEKLGISAGALKWLVSIDVGKPLPTL